MFSHPKSNIILIFSIVVTGIVLTACISTAGSSSSTLSTTLQNTVEETTLECAFSLETRLTQPSIKFGVHRADNDISTSDDGKGEQQLLPSEVIENIHSLALDHFYYFGLENTCLKLEEVYGPVISVIETPNEQQLFFLKLIAPPNIVTYHPLIFDPQQEQVTQSPPTIWGEWMKANESGFDEREHLIEKPYVFFDDINQDGRSEMVFQRRAHNGYTYNAVHYLYYSIGDDLSLDPVLVLETRFLDPLNERQVYIRTIEKIYTGNIKIETCLVDIETQNIVEEIGFAILEEASINGAYKVVHRSPEKERYEGILVSFTGYEDNSFLEGEWNKANQ